MNKKALRKKIMQLRDNQSSHDIENKALSLFEQLKKFDLFNASSCIMLYMDYKSEVPTNSIITHCFSLGKRVVIPVVDFQEKKLILVEIFDLNNMTRSKYGILEPKITKERIRTLNEVDLILSPGVAFDLKGYRLGYGGGYYDKLLSHNSKGRKALSVYALAFELQIVEAVPIEPYDQKIDGLITEKGIYHFNGGEE